MRLSTIRWLLRLGCHAERLRASGRLSHDVLAFVYNLNREVSSGAGEPASIHTCTYSQTLTERHRILVHAHRRFPRAEKRDGKGRVAGIMYCQGPTKGARPTTLWRILMPVEEWKDGPSSFIVSMVVIEAAHRWQGSPY